MAVKTLEQMFGRVPGKGGKKKKCSKSKCKRKRK